MTTAALMCCCHIYIKKKITLLSEWPQSFLRFQHVSMMSNVVYQSVFISLIAALRQAGNTVTHISVDDSVSLNGWNLACILGGQEEQYLWRRRC